MTTVSTGGQFNLEEQELHINILELKAALFGLQSLCKNTYNCHILVKVDNTVAVTSINKMGSIKSIEMDRVVHDICWVISQNNWLTATHIPGILNTEADKESRMQETRTEWMLNKLDFQKIVQELKFNPKIDLFASRFNNQLTVFVSYRPDPLAMAVNAFTLDWGKIPFYAFPPFSIIPRVLQKCFMIKPHAFWLFQIGQISLGFLSVCKLVIQNIFSLQGTIFSLCHRAWKSTHSKSPLHFKQC